MIKFNILILEDDINRVNAFNNIFELKKHNVIYHDNAPDFIKTLEHIDYDVDLMFLDHDLGNRVFVDELDINTGSEVVRYLISNSEKYKNTIFIVHSFNQPAAKNMVFNIRKNITNNVKYIPGVWQKEIFKTNIKFSNI